MDTSPHAGLLHQLTLGELLPDAQPASLPPPPGGGPPIDLDRLDGARQATGADFDAHVLAVLVEARGCAVAASYLRARVGGPRWKLQDSCNRLVQAGVVARRGTTSATRYRITDSSQPSTSHDD